jgi:hypothetical protein
MVILGLRSRVKTSDAGTIYCPRCGTDRHGTAEGQWRWLTFFFVPIFPVGPVTVRHVRCDACGATYPPGSLTGRE